MSYPPSGPGGYPPANNPAYPPQGGYPPQPGPPGYGAPPGGAPPYGGQPGQPAYGYGAPPGGGPQPYAQPGAPPFSQPGAQPYAQPGYGAPPQAAPQGPPHFYIRSEMHGKVLDIEGGNSGPGAKVIIWPRKPHRENNQLWYIGQDGCIHSMLNHFMLDASHGSLMMQQQNGNPKQMWQFQGNRIMNRSNPNEVVDIAQNNQSDGAEVCCWSYNGGSNQHWAMDWA
jgi:hypothetical protein